ncbi:hypothetical protein EL22_25300 [Halostagnicola sp. A56]|uniref:hypothetical protein n=1 Tax=Halostagnicola sp. A56 TaxID=1495067 RepID=UPI00065F6A91|nr:hypothetical protein [Halostagnicola sp. A56]KDE56689.2 hypothetical protein EL22_25300 [Halostagnicola sp. A56]
MLLPAVGIGFEDAAQEQQIEGESITLAVNETVPLEHAEDVTDNQSITVTDSSGTELVNGEDYEFDGEGIVTLTEGLDGEGVTVDYVIETQTEDTQDVGQLLSIFDSWIVGLTLFVVVGAIWAMTSISRGGGY